MALKRRLNDLVNDAKERIRKGDYSGLNVGEKEFRMLIKAGASHTTINQQHVDNYYLQKAIYQDQTFKTITTERYS